MCEANAYLKHGNEETLFMEAIDIIEPYEDGLKLVDIFGRQKFVKARIKDMTLLSHRILLEPTVEPAAPEPQIQT
ncbi:MAG: CooT family nickel-binding protein [Desulfitobacteriaceae bacterium]|nr:CooT family nickel-binding protein [Desulfitobacteriaceae bacterium]MDI6878815.1 CooT family nickel-binding protein [Desulfitobacteriaceae bacterium]MDI6914225.1 CooT family nickel-binding protein [Desulfitobacteriaceae bacterium]